MKKQKGVLQGMLDQSMMRCPLTHPTYQQETSKNTYANLPAASSADTAGTENSGYESLEMHPQNHQYESLATA